jgi:sugar phosphate isomerase/epimerase
MLWGYALIWTGQFLTRDPDPLLAKLKFLKHYGLRTTGVSLNEIDKLDERKREQVFAYLAEHDLCLTPGLWAKYLDPDRDALKRQTDAALALLERYHKPMRAPIVTTGAGGPHRFAREPGRTLAQRLDLLADGLAPVAAGCHALGLPFGIENHGDYYCSDLADLCRRVPHLGIFLDTGNTYLIGEQPLPAFEAAAPYTVGTHFKDHVVRPVPDARPLHFEVGPSVIGDGDVPLRACYELLMERAPNPDKLCMMIELIPPSFAGNDPVEAVEKSVAFVKSLGK